MKRASRPCLIGLGLALYAGLARGQDAPVSDPARQAFDEGMRGLTERRYHDAALAFERSYTLRQVPAVLYNRALAYRGIGRYTAAIEDFRAYLASPDDVTPERAAVVTDEMRELEGRLVRVDLTVQPPEAAVTVDGRVVDAARRARPLDPGPHVFECSLAGWRAVRHEIAGEPGTRYPISCVLEGLREGRLLVEPTISAVRVTIDGRYAGTGRVERVLDPGEHRVDLSAPTYLPLTRTVRVGQTGVVRLAVTLERRRAWVPWAVVGGSVALAAAISVALYFALRPESPDPYAAIWGNVQEPRP